MTGDNDKDLTPSVPLSWEERGRISITYEH